MNHRILTFTFFSAAFFLSSCQSSTTAETDPTLERAQTIYAEAIAVHDEVMPRMDELMQLRQKLELRVTSMQEQAGGRLRRFPAADANGHPEPARCR